MQRNLCVDSSADISLNDNSDPESIYESLQTSDTTAKPQYTRGGDDESLTYMSLTDNREPPNVYQSLQSASSANPHHTKEDDDLTAEYEIPNPAFT